MQDIQNKLIEGDVVVIGSGAGGGALAWRLAELGLKVVVVEAGPIFKAQKDYNLANKNWQESFPYKAGSQGAYSVTGLQSIDGVPAKLRSWNIRKGNLVNGDKRASFGYHHVRGVGGSSLHFTGEAHRINPLSMMMKSDYGVAANWPVSYEELDPYYAIAEQVVGVVGVNVDNRCPRSTPYLMPNHAFSYGASKLAEAAEKLDLNVVPNSLAVLSLPYDGRSSCNYCGGCQKGCTVGDKGSVDITYINKAVQTGNCTVVPDCEVLKIDASDSRVKHLLVSHQGEKKYVYGKQFVLAAGAIQTPRLLLTSANQHHVNGLANSSGEVGKNFMETLLTTVSALHPSKLGSHRGLPVNWVCWDYNAPDSIPGVIGGCRFSPSMAEADLIGPKAYASRVIDGWGLKHKRLMRDNFGSALSITSIGESIPNDKSYITISSKKDQYGVPIAEIHSYVDSQAIARLAFMMERCHAIIKAAGCEDPFERYSSADAFSSTHVFGTCRMGNDPINSVCDSYGKTHDLENLYIADASLFPSSGGGESPGLTIQALAIRCADNIKRRVSNNI